MSVINNLLKDLEKRENIRKENPLVALSPSDRPLPKKNRWKMTIIIFCLLFGIALAFWLREPRTAINKTEPSIPIKITTLPILSTKNLTIPALLTPVQIAGITIQTKKDITEVAFLLNHATLYRVANLNADNDFLLSLEDADMRAEIPVFNPLETGIANFTFYPQHAATQFKLNLLNGAQIKYVELNEDLQPLQLRIGIQYKKADDININHQQHVKTQAIASLFAEQYQSAINNAESGRYEEAINKLSALIAADPFYHEARVSLAALLIDQNQTIKANKIITDGLRLAPSHAPFIELRARLLANQGKITQALALLLSEAPAMLDNPEYHAFIAALYARSDNDLLAVKTYQSLLALHPDNGSWWLGLAISLEKLNRKRAALDAYNNALNKGHLNTDSFAYLQERLQQLKEETHAA